MAAMFRLFGLIVLCASLVGAKWVPQIATGVMDRKIRISTWAIVSESRGAIGSSIEKIDTRGDSCEDDGGNSFDGFKEETIAIGDNQLKTLCMMSYEIARGLHYKHIRLCKRKYPEIGFSLVVPTCLFGDGEDHAHTKIPVVDIPIEDDLGDGVIDIQALLNNDLESQVLELKSTTPLKYIIQKSVFFAQKKFTVSVYIYQQKFIKVENDKIVYEGTSDIRAEYHHLYKFECDPHITYKFTSPTSVTIQCDSEHTKVNNPGMFPVDVDVIFTYSLEKTCDGNKVSFADFGQAMTIDVRATSYNTVNQDSISIAVDIEPSDSDQDEDLTMFGYTCNVPQCATWILAESPDVTCYYIPSHGDTHITFPIKNSDAKVLLINDDGTDVPVPEFSTKTYVYTDYAADILLSTSNYYTFFLMVNDGEWILDVTIHQRLNVHVPHMLTLTLSTKSVNFNVIRRAYSTLKFKNIATAHIDPNMNYDAGFDMVIDDSIVHAYPEIREKMDSKYCIGPWMRETDEYCSFGQNGDTMPIIVDGDDIEDVDQETYIYNGVGGLVINTEHEIHVNEGLPLFEIHKRSYKRLFVDDRGVYDAWDDGLTDQKRDILLWYYMFNSTLNFDDLPGMYGDTKIDVGVPNDSLLAKLKLKLVVGDKLYKPRTDFQMSKTCLASLRMDENIPLKTRILPTPDGSDFRLFKDYYRKMDWYQKYHMTGFDMNYIYGNRDSTFAPFQLHGFQMIAKLIACDTHPWVAHTTDKSIVHMEIEQMLSNSFSKGVFDSVLTKEFTTSYKYDMDKRFVAHNYDKQYIYHAIQVKYAGRIIKNNVNTLKADEIADVFVNKYDGATNEIDHRGRNLAAWSASRIIQFSVPESVSAYMMFDKNFRSETCAVALEKRKLKFHTTTIPTYYYQYPTSPKYMPITQTDLQATIRGMHRSSLSTITYGNTYTRPSGLLATIRNAKNRERMLSVDCNKHSSESTAVHLKYKSQPCFKVYSSHHLDWVADCVIPFAQHVATNTDSFNANDEIGNNERSWFDPCVFPAYLADSAFVGMSMSKRFHWHSDERYRWLMLLNGNIMNRRQGKEQLAPDFIAPFVKEFCVEDRYRHVFRGTTTHIWNGGHYGYYGFKDCHILANEKQLYMDSIDFFGWMYDYATSDERAMGPGYTMPSPMRDIFRRYDIRYDDIKLFKDTFLTSMFNLTLLNEIRIAHSSIHASKSLQLMALLTYAWPNQYIYSVRQKSLDSGTGRSHPRDEVTIMAHSGISEIKNKIQNCWEKQGVPETISLEFFDQKYYKDMLSELKNIVGRPSKSDICSGDPIHDDDTDSFTILVRLVRTFVCGTQTMTFDDSIGSLGPGNRDYSWTAGGKDMLFPLGLSLKSSLDPPSPYWYIERKRLLAINSDVPEHLTDRKNIVYSQKKGHTAPIDYKYLTKFMSVLPVAIANMILKLSAKGTNYEDVFAATDHRPISNYPSIMFPKELADKTYFAPAKEWQLSMYNSHVFSEFDRKQDNEPVNDIERCPMMSDHLTDERHIQLRNYFSLYNGLSDQNKRNIFRRVLLDHPHVNMRRPMYFSVFDKLSRSEDLFKGWTYPRKSNKVHLTMAAMNLDKKRRHSPVSFTDQKGRSCTMGNMHIASFLKVSVLPGSRYSPPNITNALSPLYCGPSHAVDFHYTFFIPTAKLPTGGNMRRSVVLIPGSKGINVEFRGRVCYLGHTTKRIRKGKTLNVLPLDTCSRMDISSSLRNLHHAFSPNNIIPYLRILALQQIRERYGNAFGPIDFLLKPIKHPAHVKQKTPASVVFTATDSHFETTMLQHVYPARTDYNGIDYGHMFHAPQKYMCKSPTMFDKMPPPDPHEWLKYYAYS